jgi:hypothetical protein
MRAAESERYARDAKRLVKWVVEEVKAQGKARFCGLSAQGVAEAVMTKHAEELYRDQALAPLLTKHNLVPFAERVLNRYFDATIEVEEEFDCLLSAINEELAVGREPSEALWRAFNQAGQRLLARAEKKHEKPDAMRRLAELRRRRPNGAKAA